MRARPLSALIGNHYTRRPRPDGREIARALPSIRTSRGRASFSARGRGGPTAFPSGREHGLRAGGARVLMVQEPLASGVEHLGVGIVLVSGVAGIGGENCACGPLKE